LGNGSGTYDITPTLVDLSNKGMWRSVDVAASANYSLVLQTTGRNKSRVMAFGYIPCDKDITTKAPPKPKRWSWLNIDPDPVEHDTVQCLEPVLVAESENRMLMAASFNHYCIATRSATATYELKSFGRRNMVGFEEPTNPQFPTEGETQILSLPKQISLITCDHDIRRLYSGSHINAILTENGEFLVYDLLKEDWTIKKVGIQCAGITASSIITIDNQSRLAESDITGNIVFEHQLSQAQYNISSGPTRSLIYVAQGGS
jgi:hypothetical protein